MGAIRAAASLVGMAPKSTANANPPPSAPPPGAGSQASGSPPAWARKMQDEQRLRGHLHATQTALASGDQPVASANPDLSQKD